MIRSLLVLAMAVALPALAADRSPVGEWWTPGFRARVAIAPCADALCGRVVWIWDPRLADLGREVLRELRAAPGGSWRGGRAYNPDDRNEYAASLRLLDPDRLIVEGCLAFLCREQLWVRVGSAAVVPAHASGEGTVFLKTCSP